MLYWFDRDRYNHPRCMCERARCWAISNRERVVVLLQSSSHNFEWRAWYVVGQTRRLYNTLQLYTYFTFIQCQLIRFQWNECVTISCHQFKNYEQFSYQSTVNFGNICNAQFPNRLRVPPPVRSSGQMTNVMNETENQLHQSHEM